MKEWWLHLSLKDKQLLLFSSIIVIFLFFYLLIWSPLAETVDTLKENIKRNYVLSIWMEKTGHDISILEKKSHKAPATTSLLGTTQHAIANSAFSAFVSDLRQADTDSVQFAIKKVSFDKLISWLIRVWKTQGLTVTAINITPTSKTGVISAEIILKQ